MHVVDTEAEFIAQYAGGTDVGRNHRLFNDTVSNATRLGHDVQHFAFFTEDEAVVRTILKDQRMRLTPLAAAEADAMQQTDLIGNGFVFWFPATRVFQPVGDVVVRQFGFRFDSGGKEGSLCSPG
jgi:hypothetical protein